MRDWCQTAVNHLTKEEMGNTLSLSFYSALSAGDQDGVLSLHECVCVLFTSVHGHGCLLLFCFFLIL